MEKNRIKSIISVFVVFLTIVFIFFIVHGMIHLGERLDDTFVTYFITLISFIIVIDAIYMGYYYGFAKYSEAYNDIKLRNKYLRRAFFVPVLIHGFYDFCLSTEYGILIFIFLVFELVITVITIRKFLKLSKIEAVIPNNSLG